MPMSHGLAKLHFITASLLCSQNPNPQARPPPLRPPVQVTETFAGKYIYSKKLMLWAYRVDLQRGKKKRTNEKCGV